MSDDATIPDEDDETPSYPLNKTELRDKLADIVIAYCEWEGGAEWSGKEVADLMMPVIDQALSDAYDDGYWADQALSDAYDDGYWAGKDEAE